MTVRELITQVKHHASMLAKAEVKRDEAKAKLTPSHPGTFFIVPYDANKDFEYYSERVKYHQDELDKLNDCYNDMHLHMKDPER